MAQEDDDDDSGRGAPGRAAVPHGAAPKRTWRKSQGELRYKYDPGAEGAFMSPGHGPRRQNSLPGPASHPAARSARDPAGTRSQQAATAGAVAAGCHDQSWLGHSRNFLIASDALAPALRRVPPSPHSPRSSPLALTEIPPSPATRLAGTYVRSLVRAFCKATGERRHRFLVLDAPNASAADLREAWTGALAGGYQAWVASMPETDPAVCAARNVHGRSEGEVARLAAAWEPTPPEIPCIEVGRFLSGGGQAIAEVDMDSSEGEAREGAAEGPRWAVDAEERPATKPAAEQAGPGMGPRPGACKGADPVKSLASGGRAGPPRLGILRPPDRLPKGLRVVWADHAHHRDSGRGGFHIPIKPKQVRRAAFGGSAGLGG